MNKSECAETPQHFPLPQSPKAKDEKFSLLIKISILVNAAVAGTLFPPCGVQD